MKLIVSVNLIRFNELEKLRNEFLVIHMKLSLRTEKVYDYLHLSNYIIQEYQTQILLRIKILNLKKLKDVNVVIYLKYSNLNYFINKMFNKIINPIKRNKTFYIFKKRLSLLKKYIKMYKKGK